jgi:hypothetical protein
MKKVDKLLAGLVEEEKRAADRSTLVLQLLHPFL